MDIGPSYSMKIIHHPLSNIHCVKNIHYNVSPNPQKRDRGNKNIWMEDTRGFKHPRTLT
jgi:hypothetical protein